MINKTVLAAVVGRANVGKSTLTNTLVGRKIAIVTPKPQTTRNRITGVFSHGDTQVVLIDTPGFHKARSRLGEYMVGVAVRSIADVDVAVLMVEPTTNIGERESSLIERISRAGVPAILVVNKIDTLAKEELLAVIDAYTKMYNFKAYVPVCARSGEGTEILVAELKKFAEEGPALFPEDMDSDMPERAHIAELVREKLLLCLRDEVPHGVAVEVESMSERESGVVEINTAIYCERKSHKGIIIGKDGEMLKRAGEMARADIERFLGARVMLKTWVKVKENWRDSDARLRNFGYSDS